MYVSDPYQHKHQFVFNQLADAILIETKERHVSFVNTSFCTLFKLKISPEEMVGIDCKQGSIISSFLFKNPSKFLNRIDEIIENGNTVLAETITLKDGSQYSRDYFPIVLQSQIQGHFWMYKLQEQKAVTNTEIQTLLTNTIIETIDIPIALLNTNYKYVFANAAYESNTEKRKLLLGKTAIDFLIYYNKPTQAAEEQLQYAKQAIELKQTIVFEQQNEISNGKKNWQKIVFIPILSPEKSIENILKYQLDISSIKQQEHDFIEIVDNYKNALYKVKDIVLLADDKLQISFSNKRLLTTIESALNTNLNEDIFKYISLTNYGFYKDLFSVLAKDTAEASGKINLLKNDAKHTYHYTINNTKTNPLNPQGVVTILNDITQEVQLEENLLAVVKREKELNDIKSAFVNMVSHELRTPLAVISSGAELIQMMLEVGKPANEIETYTNQILKEVERMTTFMNDLLMVSKIEAGKIEYYPKQTNISNFIEELIEQNFAPSKDGRTLTITTKGIEQPVFFDEKMLRHILQNLIDNAFKYSISKVAPNIRIRFSKTYVTIAVIDHGIGIHQEDIAKLFSSFSRGRNVKDIAGTGIGLVVVKYFIEQHNGSISIKSKLDKGSIFSFKIPY